MEHPAEGHVHLFRHDLRHCRHDRGRGSHRHRCSLRRELRHRHPGEYLFLPGVHRHSAVSGLDTADADPLVRPADAAGRHGAAGGRHLDVHEKRPGLRPPGRADGGFGPQDRAVRGPVPRHGGADRHFCGLAPGRTARCGHLDRGCGTWHPVQSEFWAASL